ncbi:MAG: sulfotransferase family 2 domain-containing protein, partial [Pseudomonadota bacterium]
MEAALMRAARFFELLRQRHHSPSSVNNDLLYLPKLNAIYLGISKNACSTIKSELYRMSHGTARPVDQSPHRRKDAGFLSPADMPEERFFELLMDRRVFTFAFLRDPMARLRSCFLNRIHRLGLEPYDFVQPSQREWVSNRQLILSRLHKRPVSFRQALLEDISFSEFLQVICEQHPWEMDRHWVPQSCVLARDLIDYPFIGRIEDLDEGLNHVARSIGAPEDYHFESVRLNRTP